MSDKTIKVLLIDDDEDQYIILQAILEQISKTRYSLEWKENYDQAMQAITSKQYDVILVDYLLNHVYGTDIIKQAIQQGCQTPFILQTGYEETSIDLKAMEAGAVDYLVKEQINSTFLERSIRYAIHQKQVELELEKNISTQIDLNNQLVQANSEINKSKKKMETTHDQMQSDLNMAKEFQQAILPHIEAPSFLKIVEKYLPFEDSVSGDIYDMALTREGDLNVFIGDATGHGIAAAFMTMMVQMALNNIPPHLPTNAIMSRLNTLLNTRETEKYMSGIFLRISPEGILSATNAGHPSLIILPMGASEPVFFNAGGIPLGMFSEEITPYEEETYQLHPGDKVLVYTDGLTEWNDPQSDMFGVERCSSFLWDQRYLGLEPMLEGLLEQLHQFSQGIPCNDDLTILAFQFLGEDNSKHLITSPFDQKIIEENLDILNYLKESRIFGHLDQAILAELLPLSTFKEFPPNTDILKEGQTNTEVYFLTRGTVSVYSNGEYILSLQRIGDIFGEMSIISQKPNIATVKADDYVKVFAIRARDVGEVTEVKKAKRIQNVLYRLFALILTEKLNLTTQKARQFEAANRALSKSKAFNSAILNAIPDFIFRIKMLGDLEMEFGYAREIDAFQTPLDEKDNPEWQKQVSAQMIHYVEIVENFDAELKEVFQTGTPLTIEYQTTLEDRNYQYATKLIRIEGLNEILVVVQARDDPPGGDPPGGGPPGGGPQITERNGDG